MRTTPPGFAPFTTWDEVRAAAATSRYALYYWGAMDTRPRVVAVVRMFGNGKIRVTPMSNQADRFTLNPSHLAAGLLYRKTSTSGT